jgi:hypothetical protein
MSMATWTDHELDKIGRADELEIASLRGDGTLGKRVTIWVVPYEDDLYVRSWKGRTATWFRAAERRRDGRIWAGGVERDVTFVDAEHGVDYAIDAAYRAKYGRYGEGFVGGMVSPEARATTIKLVPRSPGA